MLTSIFYISIRTENPILLKYSNSAKEKFSEKLIPIYRTERLRKLHILSRQKMKSPRIKSREEDIILIAPLMRSHKLFNRSLIMFHLLHPQKLNLIVQFLIVRSMDKTSSLTITVLNVQFTCSAFNVLRINIRGI